MTAEGIESIIAKHEMQRIELKESFDVECIETACAFANAHGGLIFIGVTDCGEPSKNQLRRESLRDYENRISTATEPSVAVDAEKVEFRGREIVVLRVMENPLKPVAFKGRCFIRRGSVNHQMTPVEIAECHLKITGGSMDAAYVPRVTREDIDEDAVRRYMAKAVAERRRNFVPGEKPWDVLKKLDLVRSETEITRAAYLLFAKDPQRGFSQAVIHAGAFKADGAVIYDTLDVRGNIQDQIERTLEFVQKNIRCAIVVTGKAAHDRYWEYPLEAIRETLANAICHRDYGLPFKIEVKVFENRVVVSSPGPLPFGICLEDLDKVDCPSRPRNKLIAQVLYDMHVIENYGSGFRRIREECDKNGNPYPVCEEHATEFRVTYPARTVESVAKLGLEPYHFGLEKTSETEVDAPEVASTLKSTQKAAGSTLKSTQKTTDSTLKEIVEKNPSVTIESLAALLGITRDGVNKAIRRLKAAGAIRRVGPDKGGHWEIVKQSSSNGGDDTCS